MHVSHIWKRTHMSHTSEAGVLRAQRRHACMSVPPTVTLLVHAGTQHVPCVSARWPFASSSRSYTCFELMTPLPVRPSLHRSTTQQRRSRTSPVQDSQITHFVSKVCQVLLYAICHPTATREVPLLTSSALLHHRGKAVLTQQGTRRPCMCHMLTAEYAHPYFHQFREFLRM